jgi:tetratricopeptide (TPR) repeat protein
MQGNIEEEDPNWLKAKGDDFFRGGDFRSAINAYSSALELDEHNIACYSNRSTCYLKLSMYSDCKDDCSAAIKEIIGVHSEKVSSEIEFSLRPMLIKLLLRRGAASTQLGSFAEALHDYESSITRVHDFFAVEIESGETLPVSIDLVSIEADRERLKHLVTAESLKREADVLVGEKSLEFAIQKYTEALAILPCHVSCLSNRSACYLATGNIQKCIDDCTFALQFLEVTYAKSAIGSSEKLTMADTLLPAAGSEKRKDWTLKTLIRRGAASIQIGDLKSAIRDYGYAVSIDPTNEALKSDLNKLSSLASSSSLNQQ